MKNLKKLYFTTINRVKLNNSFKNAVRTKMGWLEEEKKIRELVLKLIEQSGKELDQNTGEAVRQFFEFFDRLSVRAIEIKKVELDMSKSKNPIMELQADLVNKTEAFHQQIYATISAFIKLLSHIAPKSFIGNMPSKSICNFLSFIDKTIEKQFLIYDNYNVVIQNIIDILEQSRTYRAKYVDHTNQTPSHNWITFSSPHYRVFVIYVEGMGKGEKFELTHIMHTPFKVMSPVKAEKFFIPPYYKDTLLSLMTMTKEVLKFLLDK